MTPCTRHAVCTARAAAHLSRVTDRSTDTVYIGKNSQHLMRWMQPKNGEPQTVDHHDQKKKKIKSDIWQQYYWLTATGHSLIKANSKMNNLLPESFQRPRLPPALDNFSDISRQPGDHTITTVPTSYCCIIHRAAYNRSRQRQTPSKQKAPTVRPHLWNTW